MTFEIFLRYIHFVSVFAIIGAVVSEHLLLRKTMTRAALRRLARIDAIYGLAAITLLTAGLTLWFSGAGKPTEFYSKNWIFHVKITLFAVIGILSIYPTVFFIRNRKGHHEDVVSVPPAIFWMLRLELVLLFIIPLLAALMAKGIGYGGV